VKTFYSAQEIEDLARQGVRELMVDENVVLTDLARQTADLLGVRLVTPAPAPQAPSRPVAAGAPRPAQAATPARSAMVDGASQPAPAASAGPLAARPRGCQHGPLGDRPASAATARDAAGSSAVIDDLVNAVKQLSKNRA
jgi:hypothetical protein